MKSLIRSTLVALALFSGLSATADAADYPSRPITIIVGYAAGGGTDVMARTVAPYLEKALGNGARVVIENQPGAGGQIGFSSVARAKPDGYTLGTFNLPAALALTYSRHAVYNLNSFDYLANFVADPNTLVVPTSSSIHTVAQLVKQAKARKRPMSVALSALGGNDQFAELDFARAAGIKFNQVPFGGASEARNALMGGHVDLGTMALSQTVKFDNSLRVLTVFADQRSPFAPNVPTAKSLGYNIQMGSMRGFVAPAGLPPKIRQRLIAAFKKAYANPKLQAALRKQGSMPDFVPGRAYRAMAKKYDQSAGALWKEHPWRQ